MTNFKKVNTKFDKKHQVMEDSDTTESSELSSSPASHTALHTASPATFSPLSSTSSDEEPESYISPFTEELQKKLEITSKDISARFNSCASSRHLPKSLEEQLSNEMQSILQADVTSYNIDCSQSRNKMISTGYFEPQHTRVAQLMDINSTIDVFLSSDEDDFDDEEAENLTGKGAWLEGASLQPTFYDSD